MRPVTVLLYSCAVLLSVGLVIVNVHAFRAANIADSVKIRTSHPIFAPDFDLPTINGDHWNLGHSVLDNSGTQSIAFFCGCSLCATAADKVGHLQSKGKLDDLVYVIALPKSDAASFAKTHHIRGVVLYDPSESVAKEYSATVCPQFWLIGSSRRVIQKSAPMLHGGGLDSELDKLSSAMKSDVEVSQ